jgi:LPS sulfotransferase NodH
LVIEMDGAVHDDPDQAARDLTRDTWLRDNGLTVPRFLHDDLRQAPGRVVAKVKQALSALSPAPLPPAGATGLKTTRNHTSFQKRCRILSPDYSRDFVAQARFPERIADAPGAAQGGEAVRLT